MKRSNKDWLVKLKKILHFITTVLMYSICLIMIIVFLVFVVNFIDNRHNIKAGNNKRALFSAYTIVSPSMVPSINVLDVVVTKRVDSPEDLEKGDIITFNSTDYRYSGVTVTHRIQNIEKTIRRIIILQRVIIIIRLIHRELVLMKFMVRFCLEFLK